MRNKMLAVLLMSSMVLTSCGTLQGKGATSDNSISAVQMDSVSVGNLIIKYNTAKNGISYSNWNTDGENSTTIIYNNETYSLDEEHLNDTITDLPCVTVDFSSVSSKNTEESIKSELENKGITDVEIATANSYIVASYNDRETNQNTDVASRVTEVIPTTAEKDKYRYKIAAKIGIEVLTDSSKTYTYRYSLDENAFYSVSDAVDQLVGSKGVLGTYEATSDILNGMQNSLSDYNSGVSFNASERKSTMINGSSGASIGSSGEEQFTDSSSIEITSDEELEQINQEYLDSIAQLEATDDKDIPELSYNISEQDLATKGKQVYVVGVDIEPGTYSITNNNTPTYLDGEVDKSTVVQGSFEVLQLDTEDGASPDGTVVTGYYVTEDDPEGMESIAGVDLIKGQMLRVSGIDITLTLTGLPEDNTIEVQTPSITDASSENNTEVTEVE